MKRKSEHALKFLIYVHVFLTIGLKAFFQSCPEDDQAFIEEAIMNTNNVIMEVFSQ